MLHYKLWFLHRYFVPVIPQEMVNTYGIILTDQYGFWK